MTLTKYEKETIILFNEGEDTRPHPDLQCRTAEAAGSVQQEAPRPLPLGKSFAQAGVIYVLDKSRLSIRLQAPYNEERRRKASENAKQTGFKSRTE